MRAPLQFHARIFIGVKCWGVGAIRFPERLFVICVAFSLVGVNCIRFRMGTFAGASGRLALGIGFLSPPTEHPFAGSTSSRILFIFADRVKV